MDFFARQDQARRNTARLLLYFFLSVILTVLLVYAAFAAFFLNPSARPAAQRARDRGAPSWVGIVGGGGVGWWNGPLFAAVSVGTLGVVLLGSLYKMGTLRGGGGAVARLLGGEPLSADPVDPDERQLRNVVEEMAIASGTRVPEIYVLRDERCINAFAAGFQPTEAAIGVTRGCMTLLNRDELQGVVAHEFSHILNGDMRLNVQLMGFVHGLLCIAVIGRILLRTSTRVRVSSAYTLGARRGKGGNPLPLLGLALLIIGSIGVFFGRLIKSSISRQREYLADAAAVQFTRNPPGLAGALKKIGGLTQGSRIASARAEEASHLFFGNGLADSWFNAWATHPPLIDRIRALDPNFDGTFPPVQWNEASQAMPADSALVAAEAQGAGVPVPPPLLDDLLGVGVPGVAPRARPVTARRVIESVGAPSSSHLDRARQLLAALPPHLTEAARHPLTARLLVYGLVLSPEPATRAAQTKLLDLSAAEGLEWSRLESPLSALKAILRLPLAELCLPALSGLAPSQYLRFRQTLQALVEIDRQLDLFEFALLGMVVRHLDPHFRPSRPVPTQYYSLIPLVPDSQVLLSALAWVGQSSPSSADHAFRLGMQLLTDRSTVPMRLPVEQCQLDALARATSRLNQASPSIKKKVLTACTHAASADGLLTVREAELIRAIADGLGCPIPVLDIPMGE